MRIREEKQDGNEQGTRVPVAYWTLLIWCISPSRGCGCHRGRRGGSVDQHRAHDIRVRGPHISFLSQLPGATHPLLVISVVSTNPSLSETPFFQSMDTSIGAAGSTFSGLSF